MTTKIFSGLIFLCISCHTFGQKDVLVAKSKYSGHSVLLRWAPSTLQIFKAGSRNGYDIQKAEIESFSHTSSIDWKKIPVINSSPVIPLQKEDSSWIILFGKNNFAHVIYQSLYPSNFSSDLQQKEKKQAEENLFSLGLLAVDISPDAAMAAGLFYKDTLIFENKKYAYRISVKNSGYAVVLLIDPSEKQYLPEIPSLSVQAKNKSSVLSWNIRGLTSYYAFYDIQRSDDSSLFSTLNNSPYVILTSQFEKNKSETFYSDTTIQKEKKYYYRTRGYDHFGYPGPWSNTVSCTYYTPLSCEVLIDTILLLNDSLTQTTWHLSDETQKPNLLSSGLLWSDRVNSGFRPVFSETKNEYMHTSHSRLNYYKVFSVDRNHDTLYSFPEMFLIPDKIPPQIPQNLSGEISRKGIVALQWNPVNNPDVMGYRVFRSNALKEEFTEITSVILPQPRFTDSVTLHSLTEEIYYCITAVDSNYNNSHYSTPLKLKKPDIIPPSPSPINKIIAKTGGVYLNFIPSESEDLVSTEIWRSASQTDFKKIARYINPDTVISFHDTTVTPGKGYYYKTVAIDDASNFTESQTVYVYCPNGLCPPVDSVLVTVNRQKQSITLLWKYPEQEAEKFVIYKSKKGETPRICKTLNGKTFFYTDKELYIGNRYTYYIKAILRDGRESLLSRPIEAEY